MIFDNIIFQFISWYFLEVPKKILGAWKNILKFNLEYFSIPLILKTFFSHWRQYKWDYGRGFDFRRYTEVFISNMISRILGMVMRTILISIGLLVEIFIIFCGGSVFLGWIFLPVLLINGLIFGFKLTF